MNNRGGKRAGAGRKKTRDTPTGKLIEALKLKAIQEGRTPLEVMLEAMNDAYEISAEKAFPFATAAAPYLHPRLSSVEASIDGELGTYAAQPIPVEERHPLESPAGPATRSDPTP